MHDEQRFTYSCLSLCGVGAVTADAENLKREFETPCHSQCQRKQKGETSSEVVAKDRLRQRYRQFLLDLL